jgi:hypothetical protein
VITKTAITTVARSDCIDVTQSVLESLAGIGGVAEVVIS